LNKRGPPLHVGESSQIVEMEALKTTDSEFHKTDRREKSRLTAARRETVRGVNNIIMVGHNFNRSYRGQTTWI